jgi:hypothetical protein
MLWEQEVAGSNPATPTRLRALKSNGYSVKVVAVFLCPKSICTKFAQKGLYFGLVYYDL